MVNDWQTAPIKSSVLRKAQSNKRNLSSSFSPACLLFACMPPFRLHAFRKAAITWLSLLLLKNGLSHLVPHVILHLMIYWLSLQKNGPYSEGRSCFLTNQRKPVHRFVTRDFFSISYKSMDAYRGYICLCTINGPCAWHQAFNNKNLNAKLICDFGIRVLFFYAYLRG